jgi:hypothetical protein
MPSALKLRRCRDRRRLFRHAHAEVATDKLGLRCAFMKLVKLLAAPGTGTATPACGLRFQNSYIYCFTWDRAAFTRVGMVERYRAARNPSLSSMWLNAADLKQDINSTRA